MLTLLLTVASATTCSSTAMTSERYKPRAGGVDGEAGDWPKDLLKRSPESVMDHWKKHRGVAKRYPRERQQEFLRGEVRTPIEEVGLNLAWGDPDYVWKTESGCRALLYSTEHDRLFETCKGNVVAEYEVDVPLDCERMDAVVPRVESKQGRFRDLEREQQLELLAGLPSPWMDKKDLEMAFGEPYKKRGDVWLFHDDSGFVEGPIIGLDSDGQVATVDWPANPQITKKGKRQQRKAADQARRDELSDYRKQQAKSKRRGLLKALVVVAVVATAVAVAESEGLFDEPPPAPAPSPSPSSSPSSAVATNGKETTTTTKRNQDGIDITEKRTVVDTRPDFTEGTFKLRGVCKFPFQANVTLTVKGDTFSATGETAVLMTTEPTDPIPADRVSGTIVRGEGEAVTLPGFATGVVDGVGNLSLTLGSWPHFMCDGGRLVNR